MVNIKVFFNNNTVISDDDISKYKNKTNEYIDEFNNILNKSDVKFNNDFIKSFDLTNVGDILNKYKLNEQPNLELAFKYA